MGHSLQTANKQLPQFVDDDKPTWLGDVNEAFRKIDDEFGRLQGLINSLQTQLNELAG
jgi:hypothetical protein